EKLQLEAKVLLFARLSGLHLSGRAIGRRREMRVAEAAAAAAGDQHALACFGEVGKKTQRLARLAALFVHERADRDCELEICPAVSGAIGALAVFAPPGAELRMKPVVDEGVRVRTGDDEHRSTVAA